MNESALHEQPIASIGSTSSHSSASVAAEMAHPSPTPVVVGEELGQESDRDDDELNGSSAEENGTEKNKFMNVKQFDWTGSWGWEITSIIFSLCCLAILVVYLRFIDGMRYASWQYRLSPNTIASLIVTIAKAAMLISISSCLGQLKWDKNKKMKPAPLYHMQALDQASRGPWGALEVCWRWRMRPGLATAGAFLMIWAVAMDPLAQQLLTFPSLRKEAPDEKAYVQKTNSVEILPEQLQKSNQHLANQALSNIGTADILGDDMLMAIMDGVMGTNKALEPMCSTNECRYPDFVSLGICSQCEDVTARSTQFCEMVYRPYTWNTTFPLNCTYTSPSGHLIESDIQPDTGGVTGDNSSVIFSRPLWISSAASKSMNERKPYVVSILAAKYDHLLEYKSHNTTDWEQKPPLVECNITWCERKYTGNFYNSGSHRSVVATSSENLEGFVGAQHPPDGRTSLSPGTFYNISIGYHLMLEDALKAAFKAKILNGAREYGSSPALWLYKSRNISELIARMATSMTDVIRNTPTAHNFTVQGTAYRVETYIHVRWGWIAVPIASVVASVMLLSFTILATRKQNAVLWKSSILPLLVGKLETKPEHDLAFLSDHVGEVIDMSKEILVLTESRNPPAVTEK